VKLVKAVTCQPKLEIVVWFLPDTLGAVWRGSEREASPCPTVEGKVQTLSEG
jgi:hypothetical protein